MSTRKERFRVEVQHQAGALTMKLTVDGRPWDARIQPNGSFTVASQTIDRDQMNTTAGIAGRFTETGFSARVNIRTVMRITGVRPGDPSTRTCDYQLRWSAEKM